MTKLKNTKKGMAKKALSISLVVAMLATSNVPVWAAEDLFSDGGATVETPVVEEPTQEVSTFSAGEEVQPVEETSSDSPALNKVDDIEQSGDITISDTKIGENVTATSTNIYVESGEEIHINWYATNSKNELDSFSINSDYSTADTQGYGYIQGSGQGPLTTAPGEYISATLSAEKIKKENLNQYLTAVVWQKNADNTYKVIAKSETKLIYSDNIYDYLVDATSLSLNKTGNVKVGDVLRIVDNNNNNVSVEWYDSLGNLVGTGKEYTTTSTDSGKSIQPAVYITRVDGTKVYETSLSETLVAVWGVGFAWDFNGRPIENGGIAYDAELLSVKATLPAQATEATIKLMNDKKEELTSNTITGAKELNASYKLSKDDIDTSIHAEITVKINNQTLKFKSSGIAVTESYVTLTGKPVIKVIEGGADIRPGVKLQADTTDVKAPSDPNFNDFSYQWQKWNDATDKWENIAKANEATYTVQPDDYDAEIRVAVFGGEYYLDDKAVKSDSVKVKAADLEGNYTTNYNKGEVFFNPTDFEKNKSYKDIYKNGRKLTAGEDYTLSFKGIDQVGFVDVVVTILPTEATGWQSGAFEVVEAYELVVVDEADGFVISASDTSSEYNGKAVTPSVKITNPNGQVLDASEYTVYSVGPNAGEYNVYAYVKGQGMAQNSNNRTHEITQKDINKHESDFNLVIPDAVWDASEKSVKENKVANAKIQLFDNAVSATEDLMETQNWEIETLNWGEGGVQKAIRINFDDQKNNNYQGVLTVDGKVNSRSIAQFQAQFTETIRSKATSRIYDGTLQDVLGEILDASHGSITFNDGTKLYEGRDFEYKIVKGGTDVGDVSIYVEGKGNYDGNMTLSNVYEITEANFSSTSYVKDNLTGNNMSISYDPSLGDAGADISAYTNAIKSKYTLKISRSNYTLTLGKDYWLDNVSAHNERWLTFVPTVRENKVEGHGENANFFTDKEKGNRLPVYAYLNAKNLNDSDIQVTVESAEYNGGKLVTPKVKVAYVKDGKEYVINPEYYEVKIIQSAYAQGETGKVNIVAKDEYDGLDTEKYPQLYEGNKMVDYTVGKTNLALGKIVATNGLSTLPSVAYDAAQAATEAGITLDASKYVVKDASGNIVDPKYYTVSYTDNKTVGTATITVTGKAQYEGSVSATFTITKNNLPSGTVTLMSDKLSKVYTGEDIELVKGTDYNITGELAGLKEGTDYMIVYENNVNVTDDKEKAEFKVVGINNYAGEVVKYFDITPATITSSNITLGDAVYQGGVAVRPAVTITIPGGNATLTEGTDYTVSYLKAATNAGDEGLVQITYADNKNINTKDSAKEATYKVTAKDLKDVTILEIADQEATGEQLTPEVTVMNGTVKLVEGKDYKVTYGDNKEIGLGTVTIQPADGNKNYTGSQEAVFKIIKATPEVGQPTISEIKVSGNTVTPVLSEEVDGAVGYDFVISTVEDTTNGRVDVSKNVLKTNTNFYYVEAGTYYVYCHAYKRGEDGTKQFGEWSNIMKVVVTATTPETPKITKLQKSSNGKHLKITWTKSADATGYDIVMGTAARKVNGELRPVDYGKAVKKITNGNTVSVIFYNIPKGTYYVGLHAYNRTSESGVKVFSKWSGAQKVTFK